MYVNVHVLLIQNMCIYTQYILYVYINFCMNMYMPANREQNINIHLDIDVDADICIYMFFE